MHRDSLHASVSQIVNELRKRYWIQGLRREVQRLVGKCLECKRFHARPGQQIMADLPPTRVDVSSTPFQTAGSDIFGPFSVNVNRSKHKRWIAVFGCHTTRAVHCEVLHSLTTDSYINAYRRFISRRGKVDKLVLDQGTNLRGADRELAKSIAEWNQSQLGQQFAQVGTEFKFLPPKASHQAGATERIIRLLRRHLRHVLDEQTLTDEVLLTLIIECENIVNSRPLSPVSQDVEDFRSITPNDLLNVRPHQGLPPGVFPDHGTVRLQRQWRQVQMLVNAFWRRFRSDYLPTLQARQKWNFNKSNFSVGDLVLVHDAAIPRSQWKIARVTEVYPSSDDNVRSLRLKMPNGHFLDRPITKVYMLEASTD